MAPNPRRIDERLDALYAKLPVLHCQGLCHDSCGPIEMSLRERARIEKTAGKPVTNESMGACCSMLTEDRRCSVYEIRPMICRLWGVIETLKCPYGCRPEGGWLHSTVAARLMIEADHIGGVPTKREERIIRETMKAVGQSDDTTLDIIGEFLRKNTKRPTLGGRDIPQSPIERPR